MLGHIDKHPICIFGLGSPKLSSTQICKSLPCFTKSYMLKQSSLNLAHARKNKSSKKGTFICNNH